jgi:hypothetical protein
MGWPVFEPHWRPGPDYATCVPVTSQGHGRAQFQRPEDWESGPRPERERAPVPSKLGIIVRWVVILASVVAGTAGCGGGGSSSATSASVSSPTTTTAPSATTASNWKSDPRCSVTKLLTSEIAWMDDGTIPDNAQNESSAHVLAKITKAEAQGGSCDEVRQRLMHSLG